MSYINKALPVSTSYFPYLRVMSHFNESCHTSTSHVTYQRLVSHINESCHASMSHVKHTSHVTCQRVMSLINESCHASVSQVMSNIRESRHIPHNSWRMRVRREMVKSPSLIVSLSLILSVSFSLSFSLSLFLSLSFSLFLSLFLSLSLSLTHTHSPIVNRSCPTSTSLGVRGVHRENVKSPSCPMCKWVICHTGGHDLLADMTHLHMWHDLDSFTHGTWVSHMDMTRLHMINDGHDSFTLGHDFHTWTWLVYTW